MGYVYALLAAILFGANGSLTKLILETDLSAPQLTLLRTLGIALSAGIALLILNPRGFRVGWRGLAIMAVLGVPALAYGCHMRARRRQGWWVTAFGAAATAAVGNALANPLVTTREAGLSVLMGLVVGGLLGWLVIRADLLVTGGGPTKGRGRRSNRRAEEAEASSEEIDTRPQPTSTEESEAEKPAEETIEHSEELDTSAKPQLQQPAESVEAPAPQEEAQQQHRRCSNRRWGTSRSANLSGKPWLLATSERGPLRTATGTGFRCRSLPITQRAIRSRAYIISSSHDLSAVDR